MGDGVVSQGKNVKNVVAQRRFEPYPAYKDSGVEETARIDALVGKVRDAVDRLRDLRTAPISAAVTGKIDVREEAAA